MGTWIYQLRPFPNQSPFKAIITLLTFQIYFYHQISCTYTFLDQFYAINTFLTPYTIKNLIPPEYSLIGYVCIPLLLFLTLISAIYNQDKYSGIRYLLSWIGIRVFPILRILLQLNIALAAYFTILNGYCLILFAITAFLNLIATFFLQNYSINKDFMMCGNLVFSLIWRLVLYINIVASQIIVWYQAEQFYNIILSFRVLCMWGLWVIYLAYGLNIYRRFEARFVLALSIIIYVCTATGQWIDQMVFILQLHISYFDYIYIIVLVLPLIYSTYSFFSYKVSNIYQKQNKNLKNKIFFLKDKIDNFDEDIEAECFIRGLVLDHYLKKCINLDCYCHKQIHYDSKNNKECDIDKIGVSKSPFCKLLMQCWYQSQVNQKSIEQKIDFAEFLFLKVKNTFRSLVILQGCKSRFQFPFDKLRIARLKKQIQIQNVRLNKELYNGTLDIQFIIDCEKIFQKVKSLISDVLKNNKSFWSTVYNNKVDLTQLVKTVKPNIKTMETINDEWKLLSNYFDIQRKWKFFYAWYTLYVKNQKLKPVILQCFTTEVNQQDIFTDANFSNKGQQVQSGIIFQQLSAAIHICSSQKSTIRNVSNSFTKLFGYQHVQIIESPLEVLMTQTVSNVHNTLLHQWSYQAKSATQPNYHIRKVYIKHKSGQLIAANKHIKQLITPTNQLQFVALLKTFDQEQNVAIADASLSIEGMTENLFKSLNFASIGLNHNYIKNINLSLLIPKLIKLSDYSELLSEQDKCLFGIVSENKKKLRKKQYIYQNVKVLSRSFANLDIDNNQQINTQCQFKITNGFKQYVINYMDNNHHALQKSDKINIIKQAIKIFKQQQTLCQFSCKLKIVPKIIKDYKYYEITFTQLVNSNKNNLVKSIMRRRERITPSLIASQFHKNFQADENNKIFSLEYSNNIFIKQENNKPMRKLFHINILKQFGRLLYICFIATTLTSAFVSYFINFSQYITISKQITVMENIDLHSFYFENNLYQINYYNQNLLPVEYRNEQFFKDAVDNIQSTFLELQTLKNTAEIKQTIFNTAINPLSKYGTTYNFSINSQFNSVNINFDELDFVMKIFQMIQLIRFNGFDDMNLTDWTLQFIQFYMTPAFQNIAETIQSNLFKSLYSTISHSMKITVIIYIILAILFISALAIAVYKITNIVQSFISIIGVFTNFNQQDIEKIFKYSNFLSNLFKYLKIKDKQQRTLIIQQQDPQSSQVNIMNNLTFDNKIYQTVNSNNININKKIKKIQVGSILNKIRLQTYGLIILTLILFVCGCFYSNTFIRIQNQKINALSELGNKHFQHYTTLTRVLSAVHKKYTNSSTYQSYFDDYYQQQIQSLMNFKNNNQRATNKNDFQFGINYNIIYFENVCKYLIIDNLDDLKECQNVADNSLQFGIQSYVYHFADKAVQYLNNNLSIDYTTIFQFQKGLKYVNRFMLQLTNMWIGQYQQTVNQSRHNIVIYSVGILLGLTVVYLGTFELLTIRNLNSQYETFRNIYQMYMPDYLVTKEKIIKAKLVTDGILDR